MPRNRAAHETPKSARTLGNPRRHAGVRKKKTNRMSGWSWLLVVRWNPAPNLCNSAPCNRFELLRKGAEFSPNCRQSYQFCPTEVTSQVHQTERQSDSHVRN